MNIEELMVIDKMAQWRPDDWINPYGLPYKNVKDEQWAYEEGATAMLKYLMMQQLGLKEKH